MTVLCDEHNKLWGICKTIPATCSQCKLEAAEARIARVTDGTPPRANPRPVLARHWPSWSGGSSTFDYRAGWDAGWSEAARILRGEDSDG